MKKILVKIAPFCFLFFLSSFICLEAEAQKRRRILGFQPNQRNRKLVQNELHLTAGVDIMAGVLGGHYKPGITAQLSYNRMINSTFSFGIEAVTSKFSPKELTSIENNFGDYSSYGANLRAGVKYSFTKKFYAQGFLNAGYVMISYSSESQLGEFGSIFNNPTNPVPEEIKAILGVLSKQELEGGLINLAPQIGLGFVVDKQFDFIVNTRVSYMMGELGGELGNMPESQKILLNQFDPSGSLINFFNKGGIVQENAVTFSLNVGIKYKF